ncbi:MAG TPA: hypothetical protein VFX79_00050 [Candidatus Saccharimonadales bacterium]|nr:hypothetical protein [Candidatus Saccharimonadales bacterium]
MQIELKKIEDSSVDYAFNVEIDDYKYKVTFTDAYYKKLTDGKIGPEELVKKSFEFLLEREAPSSILAEFDLPTIQKYFPEYESTVARKEV